MTKRLLVRWHSATCLVAASLPLMAYPALCATFPLVVQKDNPVAYYRMNDPLLRTNINVNIGSVGSVGNATNINAHLIPGAIVGNKNAAMYFDSTARTIIPWAAALNPNATSSFTVEAWFYPTSDKVVGAFVGPAPIMNRYSGSVANRQGWVYFQRNPDATYAGDGQTEVGWNFRTYTGVGSHVGINITSQQPYKLGQWQHVVTVWDAAAQTATMYINGVQAATGGNTSADPKAYEANTSDHGAEQAANGPAGLSIGSYNNTELGSNPFRGAVDEFAFYAKKLTAAQILAHYQNATNAQRTLSYEALVQSDGPVDYLRLDDPVPGSDVAINMGLLQNAGMATNTLEVIHPVDSPIAGTTDSGYGFHWRNGSGTVDMPWNAGMNPSAFLPFTIEAWFRPTSDRINPGACPINNRLSQGAVNRTGWVFFQRAPNDTYSGQSGYEGVGWNFRLYQGAGGASSDVVSGVPYTVGEWQHVVASWDGAGTATIYVNGVGAATNFFALYTENSNPPLAPDDALAPADFAIGSYNKASGGLGNNPFEGDIDEVALYSVLLNPDQVLAHYQNGTNSHRGTNYETVILGTPYDGAGTQALQPVSYFRFNEPAFYPATNNGTLTDSATASLVVATNSAVGPTLIGFEPSNQAVALDGSKGWIGMNDPSGLNISGKITLEAWIKPGTVQSNLARIVSHGPPPLTSYPSVATNGSVLSGSEVFLRIEGAGATYAVGCSDGTNTYEATYAVPAGDLGGTNWIYLAGTYDGTNWVLFRNGAQVASAASTVGALSVNNAGWAIGAAGNGWTNNLAGNVDEVAIYNVALTPGKIASHYAAATQQPRLTITRSGSNLIVTWPYGTLQEATSLTGTFTDLPSATSPYTVPSPTGTKFYRFKL